jgi:hypothetical protein
MGVSEATARDLTTGTDQRAIGPYHQYHAIIRFPALARAFRAQTRSLKHDYEPIPALGHCRAGNAHESVAEVFATIVPDRVAGVTALLRHLIYEEEGSYELRGARSTAR